MTSHLDVNSFNAGWVIQKEQGAWCVNGYTVPAIEDFFRDALGNLGLFEGEITEFIHYWFGEKQLFVEDGTYLLRQIPLEVINEHFQLTTHSYTTNRVFFTCSYIAATDLSYTLSSPQPVVSNVGSIFILHEWGIIFQ